PWEVARSILPISPSWAAAVAPQASVTAQAVARRARLMVLPPAMVKIGWCRWAEMSGSHSGAEGRGGARVAGRERSGRVAWRKSAAVLRTWENDQPTALRLWAGRKASAHAVGNGQRPSPPPERRGGPGNPNSLRLGSRASNFLLGCPAAA